mmetsp:Transcript_66702/g.171781  ORF Transcript_66702/g.171781 Transcript_66702/m.171781 type:complete len:1221 (+) Transcript_66702:79-3741(+)
MDGGGVHEVVLENFKSYDGRVVVGPFKKFTCVVGPNGAGKSNLVDAISFVLGVRTRHLRSGRMQELVHRKEHERPEEVQRTAAVELTFVPPGGGGQIVFRRTIQPSGEARSFVNGEAVTQAEYMQRLEGINILSQARNFLVLQGDVESAARRQGRDLTALFEQISGSAELRMEYERLAAEKAQKEDAARLLYSRKRTANNERKRVAQQKEEAEMYRELEARRRQRQVEYYLFRFHCIDWKAAESSRLAAEMEHERGALAATVAQHTAQINEAEQERARSHLGTTQVERAMAAARAKLEKVSPENVQVRSRLEVLRQRQQDLGSHAQRDERRRSQLSQQTETLRTEQQRLEKGMEDFSEKAQKQLPFTSEQRNAFETASRAAEQMTKASSEQVQELERKIKATANERGRMELEARELAAKSAHARQKVQDLTELEAEVVAAHEKTAKAVQDHNARVAKHRRLEQEHAHEREQLLGERDRILKAIQDITAYERHREHEQRLTQVSRDLMQVVPGVHGRVLELCATPQPRMRVAVNVALGGYLDAVICETAEGGRQCVRYLKDHMLDPMTFLPLDSLKVAPADRGLHEAVRNYHGVRMALSCVSSQHVRALEFLLGDVVIADTLEEGRHFVFHELRARGLGCRLVTLGGETISRDGNMAVSSEAARDGATRFDFQALGPTRERLEVIDRRLHEIHVRTASVMDPGTAQEEARRLEARLRECERSRERCQADLTLRREELRGSEAAAATVAPQAQRLAEDEANMREEQRQLEEGIGKVVRGHFAQLSTAMGVDDIRKTERDWRRGRDEAMQRQGEITQQLGSVRAEMAMVEQTLQECLARDPQKEAADIEAEINALQGQHERLAESSTRLRSEMEEHGRQLEQLQQAERTCEQKVAMRRRDTREEQQRLADAERRLTAMNAEVQALNDARADLLCRSVLEDVEVPVVGGTGDEELAVDLSALPEEKQAVTGGEAAKLIEEEYCEELSRIAGELEKLRPNMKAIDQLEGAAGQAAGAKEEAQQATMEIEAATARFEEAKQERRRRFMVCFSKVQEEINAVYKRLTAETAGPGVEGGSAFLDLEDLDEPYSGGVKFTTMPPMKRICDVGQLSGGERTIAAMALLFAVQAFQKPPFLLLDEIDAHLDKDNMQALARYIARYDCQTIVVSLKDGFFTQGQGLVGVSRDKRAESSVVLTCDLDRFRAKPLPAPLPPAPLAFSSPAAVFQ